MEEFRIVLRNLLPPRTSIIEKLLAPRVIPRRAQSPSAICFPFADYRSHRECVTAIPLHLRRTFHVRVLRVRGLQDYIRGLDMHHGDDACA